MITTTDAKEVSQALSQLVDDNAVYVCIGTSQVLCDSLGPRVGQELNDKMTTPMYIYGLTTHNITAENLVKCCQDIKAMHPNSKIVAIDAGVGSSSQIGRVQVGDYGICPGAATNKGLPSVGDVSIVGIVADKCMLDFYLDTPSKETLIQQLTDTIVQAILQISNAAC